MLGGSAWPRKGARGLSLEGKPPFPSLAFRSTWRNRNKLGINYAVCKLVRVCVPPRGPAPGRGAQVPRAASQGPLLALAEAPSPEARLGPHKQLSLPLPPHTSPPHTDSRFSPGRIVNIVCARVCACARTRVCCGWRTTPWLFAAKGGTGIA